MKEALISVIRQEHSQVVACIAAELARSNPDTDRLETLREEARNLRRQLDRFAED